jgi:AraC-like DNA-binding protein
MITFIVQLFLSIIGNHRLLTKYGHKAGQFYSSLRDSKNRHGKMLNYSILAMSAVSLIAILLGRFWLMSKDVVIYVVWTVFSVSLYVMGYLGLNQKIINPAVDNTNGEEALQPSVDISDTEHKKLLDKIHRELTINKIYLNNNLIIMDLVKIVGTNRSYISAAINQQYNQNFCSFVNTYRIEELKCLLVEKPDYRNIDLAEVCGFGSVNSMKRAVTAKTGLPFPDFKEQILRERRRETDNIGMN